LIKQSYSIGRREKKCFLSPPILKSPITAKLLSDDLNTPAYPLFAENGKIAVDMFKSKKYDLVLMDIQMPVTNEKKHERKNSSNPREHYNNQG
jgi:chemotaxis response regulator CheB